MNWDAFYERIHNQRHIVAHLRQGHKVLEVERRKVSFKGRRWLDLADYDKRKFENNLFLEHTGGKLPIKVLYV
jgi:hypothetical protein